MLRYGIDVSHCQGKINWNKLSESNPEIKFAILRTGYSYGDKYMDTQFMNNVTGCKNAGIDIYGVYHFSYALSKESAVLEAKECIKKMDAANLPESTVAFFDFEYGGEDFCRDHKVTCDTAFIKTVTEAFCNEIRKAGYTPGVYLNVDYYERMYKRWLPDGVKVWAAKWVNYTNGKVLPITGNELEDTKKHPPFKFDLWQYGATTVPSIGTVDADVMFVEADEKTDEVKMESKKSLEEVALEVVRGEWGNGAERRLRLEEQGYPYREVQNIVNRIIDEQYNKNNK